MDDNVTLPGTGVSVAADEVGGVQYQRIKVMLGANGVVNAWAVGSGNIDTGTPRVAIATDDVNLSAIKTAVELIDDAVAAEGTALGKGVLLQGDDGVDRLNVTVNAQGALLVAGDGSGTPVLVQPGSGEIFDVAVRDDEYETVAASQTAQVLGTTGAVGDKLVGLLIIPASTSPGNVIIIDNATSITVFAGGTDSVSNLVPFFVPLGIRSVSGAWKITTGTNVSVIAVGSFT